MLKKTIIAGGITLLILANIGEISTPPLPKLLYNPTESAPVGWYKIQANRPINVGDKIAVYPPDWARKLGDERRYLPQHYPLIKSVWAVEGTEICYENGIVRVPNYPDIAVLVQDSLGRDMPVYEGCYTLLKNEIFLASNDLDASWDSRYFGAVGKNNVLGHVDYIGKGIFKK